MILGTAAYMSPEQARGEAVDKRADIWAFGVILYELLTGQMLFGGSKNVSDALAAVLTREPDFKALPKGTPPRVRRILELCLRKDPKLRMRDIGDTRLLLDEPEPELPAAPAPSRRWLWATGFVTLAAMTALVGYRWLANRPSGPFQRIQITRVTDSGKATAAAISPDGKYVVHALTDEGKSSLWIRHTATGSNVQILAPSPEVFRDLRFSRDGNSLYYISGDGQGHGALHTMPVLGGNSRTLTLLPKISTNRGAGLAALSPDEQRLAITLRTPAESGLITVNLDGSGERRLSARQALLGPAWSPDGKTIAAGAMTHQNGMSTALVAIPTTGGPQTQIASRLWYYLNELLWLPGGRGLLTTAAAQWTIQQVWYVPYPAGRARSITSDLNSYSGLSLTADAGILVTVQSEELSHLWVVAPGDPASAREITTGRLDGLNKVAWAGNSTIYFEAPDSIQDTQIWAVASDGSGRRQITTDHLTGRPAPCGNGRYLVFLSYRAGTPHIWRSDVDGGNIRQLTHGDGEWAPDCSPDGAWFTFNYSDRGISRMPVERGEPVRIWDHPGVSAISPDGNSVLVMSSSETAVAIMPATGGQPIRTFDRVQDFGGGGVDIQWAADGKALLYARKIGGVSNIWIRPLDGGQPKPVTSFATERITAFAVSPDGKWLALARGRITSDVVMIRDLK